MSQTSPYAPGGQGRLPDTQYSAQAAANLHSAVSAQPTYASTTNQPISLHTKQASVANNYATGPPATYLSPVQSSTYQRLANNTEHSQPAVSYQTTSSYQPVNAYQTTTASSYRMPTSSPLTTANYVSSSNQLAGANQSTAPYQSTVTYQGANGYETGDGHQSNASYQPGASYLSAATYQSSAPYQAGGSYQQSGTALQGVNSYAPAGSMTQPVVYSTVSNTITTSPQTDMGGVNSYQASSYNNNVTMRKSPIATVPVSETSSRIVYQPASQPANEPTQTPDVENTARVSRANAIATAGVPAISSSTAGAYYPTLSQHPFTTVTYNKQPPAPGTSSLLHESYAQKFAKAQVEGGAQPIPYNTSRRARFARKQKGACSGINEMMGGSCDANGGALGMFNCGCCDRPQRVPVNLEVLP